MSLSILDARALARSLGYKPTEGVFLVMDSTAFGPIAGSPAEAIFLGQGVFGELTLERFQTGALRIARVTPDACRILKGSTQPEGLVARTLGKKTRLMTKEERRGRRV